ncbi:hypothetical protein BDV96DRAFT_91523 [Lophiotrema nucula]|uniref:DUF7580 domain-containing protein n=1 Tax=Lophiotrema nucula TaxID=690887 RepID=A0A6A5Z7K4_9PLEO|nr:hypothetical protein BDV96DRAFT_91523 [Lophiotrema nucula]
MSGVEVAGIALAVLPLFISALEDYEEGLDPIKSFMRWERELPKFIRKLRNQHVHFAQTMRLLLEPITTDVELDEMLDNPSGRMWKDADMSRRLEDRLQESYHAYQSTILDIEKIMKKIALKLDLDRAKELSRNDLEAMLAANRPKGDKFEFRKRVRFGMGKKTIKGLLEELDECNKELERFSDRSEKLETVRRATKPLFATKLQQIQSYAQSLHSTLVSSWSCSCKSYHQTNLQLEQRGNLYVKKLYKTAPKGTSFMVSFSSSGDTHSHPWTWQEAEIRIAEDDCYTTPQPSPKLKPKVTKTVSFGNKPPPPYSKLPDPTASLSPSPTLQEVKDLCASIQRLHKSSPCIGFSFDSQKCLRGVYPVDLPAEKPALSKGDGAIVTLEELLATPLSVNGRPLKLSKKERYALAVTLASSTLQLNSTPWFPDDIKAKDILFHRTTGPRLVDIDHPYVTPKLVELTKDTIQKPRGFHNKNTVLLGLAIALLELYFGISAEQHQVNEGGAPANGHIDSNPWQLCAIAYEWTEMEQENLSAAFLTAVKHCLRCFSDPGASLQDSDFLQAAVEGIVLPLQEELYQFLGKTAA